MDLALLVYGISLLKGITTFFGIALGVCAFLALANLIDWSESYDGNATAFISRNWKVFCVAVICAWVLIFTPSERTAYTMVGAYAAQRVAENEKVQQMSGKVLAIIEQRLDGYIAEGLDSAKEAVKDKSAK